MCFGGRAFGLFHSLLENSMHDLDRLRLEDEDEYGAGLDNEYGDLEDDEMFGEAELESGDQLEGEDSGLYAEDEGDPFASEDENGESEVDGFEDSPLTQAEEDELAAELSEITHEDELNEFLKKAVKRIGGRVLKQVGKPLSQLGRIAQPVMPLLRSLARQAIPNIACAIGTKYGGPVGCRLAKQIALQAIKAVNLESGGSTVDQANYEMSLGFVQTLTGAVQRLARSPRARAAVKQAVYAAAKQHSPAVATVMRAAASSSRQGRRPGRIGGRRRPGKCGCRQARGVWRRVGHRIILYVR
jgi:hypothetical protein